MIFTNLSQTWNGKLKYLFFLEPHGTRCCSSTGQLLELANIPEHCYPIVLPDNDPITTHANIRCMNFVRTITDRDRNCIGGNQPAEQVCLFFENRQLFNNYMYIDIF